MGNGKKLIQRMIENPKCRSGCLKERVTDNPGALRLIRRLGGEFLCEYANLNQSLS
jgi:hypothetical protein